MANHTIPRPMLLGVLVCFFLSGAAGLIYQVAWGKALGLVFGHTVYAIATVLAVFMGGLAVGSAVLGRWSERYSNPVTLYGGIEIVIAATGALSLVGLAGVRTLYLATYHAAAGSTPTLVALRFVASAVVLFIPTFLMGGTLPILVRGLTRGSAELGARISQLYWVNTLGAVAGTLAAGFLLLPALGLKRTIAIAAAMNVLAGLVALRLAKGARTEVAPATAESQGGGGNVSRFLLASFSLVGATAIGYEVAWSRLLATTLGSSTYAFTLMLATFLVGIVLGSALFEWWVRRGGQTSLATYALTQTLTGLAALGFLLFFQRIPMVVPLILQATGESFRGLLLAQFATSMLAMLPAAVVFGFNFPVVSVLIAGRDSASGHAAEAVGRAYAANTLGAIIGATATGFWLIPQLGAFRVVALAATLNLLLALVLQFQRSPRRVVALAVNFALLAGVAVAGWSGFFYDRAMASFNTVLYWDLYESSLTLQEVAATTDFTFVEDGLNATVTVARTEDYISLRTNGKVDASNRDTITQLLVGHLGATFHPAPHRVLIIGFGSGMTVSAVSRYPEVERIDCVEIEPAVLHAAPQLEPLNRGVLRDPRVHIILDDGRNFLLTSRDQYDLIISEPSNPWIAGVATLFTDEFYREVRGRLAPGGILVQWIQAYSLFPEDLRMVLATLVPHFPQVTLWRAEPQDLLLLAQPHAAPLTLDRLRTLWNLAPVREDYQEIGLRRPEGLAAFYLLDDEDVRRLVEGAPRNTDDHTRLEYRAPRSLLAKGLGERNEEMIRKYRTGFLPRILRVDDPATFNLGIAETLLKREEYTAAMLYLASLPSQPPRHPVELLRGELLLATGKLIEAKKAFTLALQLDPASLEAAHGFAEVARRLLNYDQSQLLLMQILARDPSFAPALKSLAQIERSRENWEAAANWQRRFLAAKPSTAAEEYAELGRYLAATKDSAAAEAALREALERDPYNALAHRTLADLLSRQGQFADSLRHLEILERYHPTATSELYSELARTYRSLGQPRNADRAVLKGLRLFPADAKLLRESPSP